MPAKGITLLNSSLIGSSFSTAQFWDGGRTALVVNGATYSPAAVQLQMQGPSGAWINVGSSVSADGMANFDAPSGQYRMTCQSGSVLGIYAVLVSVPYV